jgi:hypothetical protein
MELNFQKFYYIFLEIKSRIFKKIEERIILSKILEHNENSITLSLDEKEFL